MGIEPCDCASATAAAAKTKAATAPAIHVFRIVALSFGLFVN
jgi:hypothetical protein